MKLVDCSCELIVLKVLRISLVRVLVLTEPVPLPPDILVILTLLVLQPFTNNEHFSLKPY